MRSLGLLALLIVGFVAVSVKGQASPDRANLLTVLNALTTNYTPIWDTSSTLCGQVDSSHDKWSFNCNGTDYVTTIMISVPFLQGSLSTAIGLLSALTSLQIAPGKIQYPFGTIPTELGQLKQLQQIAFIGIGVNGSLPTELGSLDALTQISVNDTLLSSTIPTELGRLSSLNLFNLLLSSTNFTGTIPPQLGVVSGGNLDLSNTRLSGTVPAHIFAPGTLSSLRLENTTLSGSIPTTLGSVHMSTLFLGYSLFCPVPNYSTWATVNDWDGTACNPASQHILLALWNDLSNHGSLSWNTTLYICGQEGVVCDSGNQITSIDLKSLGLSGSLPTELGLLSGVTQFSLSGNNLTGTIPTELGLVLTLESIDFDTNHLSGPIPTQLGALTALTNLTLANNTLTGAVPTQLESLGLEVLLLANNSFTCPVTNYSTWATINDSRYYAAACVTSTVHPTTTTTAARTTTASAPTTTSAPTASPTSTQAPTAPPVLYPVAVGTLTISAVTTFVVSAVFAMLYLRN